MGLFKRAIAKVRSGLERTRAAFAGAVTSLLRGKRLDDELIAQLERTLIQADVGVAGTRQLIDRIRAEYSSGRLTTGDEVLEFLKAEMKALWPPEDRAIRFADEGTGPTVIIMAGVNGVGKTTSIAKLCRELTGDGKSVLLGACDTFRAGAVRQLEIWSERLGVDVVKGQQGGDPAAVAFDAVAAGKARGVDVVILDTAGRLQTQEPLMRQLSKLTSVVRKHVPDAPHEVLLVLDATTGQNALRQAEEFGKSAGVTGIFLSKLDGTARGGIVVAIKHATDIPVKLIGVGETPDDVQPFDPDTFVEALFSE